MQEPPDTLDDSGAGLKSTFAFAAGIVVFIGCVLFHRRQRSTASALLMVATLCFIVVALTHVFEAHGVLASLGWGWQDTLGHYIDLSAAVLGVIFVVGAVMLTVVRRPSRLPDD